MEENTQNTETETTVQSGESAAPHGGRKKAVRIALSCLGYAVLALLAITLIWLLVDKYIRKSPAPGAFGYSTLIVATGSMSGTIEAGDMVIIHAQKSYAEEDIITFMPAGATIPTTHRIERVNDDGTFVTKGDANNAEDRYPVTQEMILGEVVGVIPRVGLFAEWLARENGWMFLAAALLLVGAGIYVLRKK